MINMHDEAINIVKEILSKLGVEVENIEVVETSAHPLITIHTPESGMLIGRDGEHLRALNNIVKRIAEKKLPEDSRNFLIDVNGYHKKRIDELEKKAKLAADRVRLFNSEVSMEAMSAYERMVIHSIFTNDPDVTTESKGEGPMRHVIIKKIAPDEEETEVVNNNPTRI